MFVKVIFLNNAFLRYSKSPNADDVYVTGSMTDWQCVKMSKPPGEAAWVHIIDTRNGIGLDVFFVLYIDCYM